MRLSRTGWNNVIIFSVMIIIIFLNFTNNKLFRRNGDGAYTQDVAIFKDHAVILTLTINQQIKIERIGQTWRMAPVKLKTQALEQMMLSWQQATGNTETLKYDLSKQTAINVTAVLAGEDKPQRLSLYPTQDQLLLFNHQTEQWLSLPLAIYYQLIPAKLFAQ